MRGSAVHLEIKEGSKVFPSFSLRLTVHPMETHEQQFGAKVSKIPLWIIEYIWTHKMADVLKDVGPSAWPEMGSQPLSLQDPGRLRVVSARVYSIVRNRDVEHFEKVLNFLEETHTLLPRLVAPIKHMKIVFGLKTMLIMWMLKRERGMIDTMFKINQFFPSRLPQYQNQCNQREIFLMKKNHLDFKHLAQTLAMDKSKLERYVRNQMQQQYGDHYAQKVEDRLLQYLQKLETALPGDAYIDKLLKRKSPATEEEKLLLEVVSSDSETIATTLKKLLHCEVASLDLVKAGPEYRAEGPQRSQPPHSSTSFESNLEAENLKTASDIRVDSPPLLEKEKDSEFGPFQGPTRADRLTRSVEKESCAGTSEELNQGSSEELDEVNSSPQFCSKHRRWVKSILQECPQERSDDLPGQANAALSPPLFQSSSSRTSSQDLTPSDLIPCPADQQPPASDASDRLQTCENSNSNDRKTSGSSSSSGHTSKTHPSLQPASPGDPQVSPTVQTEDGGGPERSIQLHQALASLSAAAPRRHPSFSSSSEGQSPLPQGATSDPPENLRKTKTDHRPSWPDGHGVRALPTRDASTSTDTKMAPLAASCHRKAPVDAAVQRTSAPLRLSLPSQAVLLQSRLLQPCVSLRRLSAQHLRRATRGRSSAPSGGGGAGGTTGKIKEEDDGHSSFDLNLLYSSRSSSSGGEDSTLWDPDYEPPMKKERLQPEYEALRNLL